MLKKEIILPIIILIICSFLCFISKKIIYGVFGKISHKKTDIGRQKTILNLIDNIVKIILIAFSIIFILEIYGVNTKTLLASIGIIGLITGLAVQDLLKDFIVGFSIIFEDQFSIGDWVSIGGFKGEVMPSNLRTTKLRAYTGEIKIIYNRNINEVINYSTESTNLLVDISVSYETDIKKVKSILDKLCVDFKKKFNLKQIECIGIQKLTENSIDFRIVILTKYMDQFNLDRELKKEIILLFKQNNIVIPYKQVVIHNGKRV